MALKNVKIIVLQPADGARDVAAEKMSLSTLLEAAKFLEMQEERQHRTAADTQSIGPVSAAIVNGGNTHITNGINGSTPQTFSLQPVKIVNARPTATLGNGSATLPQSQPTQTVVISSNNISSAFLQGPVTFSTGSPTTVVTSSQNGANNGLLQQKKELELGPAAPQNQRRIMQNSFDIMNPLVIDETGPTETSKKIKQPPMVFRSGTREVHNKLEKCRRAHLKECFDILKKQLPASGDEKKTSNLSILHSALKYIQTLKRRETEYEHQLERLAREKIAYQQRLATLKKDGHFDHVDFSKLITEPALSQRNDSMMEASPSNSNSSLSPSGRLVSPTYSLSDAKMDQTTADDTYSEYSDECSTSAPLNIVTLTGSEGGSGPVIANSVITAANGENKVSIPVVSKASLPVMATPSTQNKEVTQPVQTTGISVLPMSYPMNQGLVLQKVAIVPHKGLTDLAPIVSTHFITTPQQLNGINGINGKVVPLTQYIVKPMVVVSTPSPRPGS